MEDFILRFINLAIFIITLLCTSTIGAQSTTDLGGSEDIQKAKIIKHLIQSVSWPKEAIAKNTLSVCILGAVPAKYKTLDGTKINSNIIVIKNPSDYLATQGCQLVFIPHTEKQNSKKIITFFKNKPVLVLSDIDNFAAEGGSANFTKLNDKLALTLNLFSLNESGLKIDLKAYTETTIIPEKKDLE